MKGGGETFKKKVGELVLPADFQVYCDPTLRSYAGEELNGFYLYDDQGVKEMCIRDRCIGAFIFGIGLFGCEGF